MKKNIRIIFLFSLLLALFFPLWGCKDKKFSLEGPIEHVVFDKERYSPNEEAVVKIFKTKKTDITEPLALFKIVNQDGTIFKTVDDLTKLESRDNYYIYKMVVPKSFAFIPEYYFKDIKKGIKFSDKIYEKFDYHVIYSSIFSITTDVKFLKHRALPYTTNKFIKIVFMLSTKDVLELGRVFINGVDVFKEKDKPGSLYNVSSEGSTGFSIDEKIKLTIEIQKGDLEELYTVTSE